VWRNFKDRIFIPLFAFWYLLHAKYIEGAVDSRTGKVYIAVKQIAGPTDILLCAVGVNNVATEQI
jgi:hypothetical protein